MFNFVKRLFTFLITANYSSEKKYFQETMILYKKLIKNINNLQLTPVKWVYLKNKEKEESIKVWVFYVSSVDANYSDLVLGFCTIPGFLGGFDLNWKIKEKSYKGIILAVFDKKFDVSKYLKSVSGYDTFRHEFRHYLIDKEKRKSVKYTLSDEKEIDSSNENNYYNDLDEVDTHLLHLIGYLNELTKNLAPGNKEWVENTKSFKTFVAALQKQKFFDQEMEKYYSHLNYKNKSRFIKRLIPWFYKIKSIVLPDYKLPPHIEKMLEEK